MTQKEKRPPLGKRLAQALDDVLQYEKGRKKLQTTEYFLPEPPPTFDARRIAALRTRLRLTQLEFSRLLGVSINSVESWEQGLRTPGGNASRLLQFIESPDLLPAMLAKTEDVRY